MTDRSDRASILFIGNDRSQMVMTKLLLRSLGHACEVLDDLGAAMNLLRHTPRKYDLILGDFEASGISGEALIDRLSRVQPDIPIVLCTSVDGPDQPPSCALRNRACLTKPVERERLAETIRQTLVPPPPSPGPDARVAAG